jgi:hypothetical protein
MTRKRLRIIYIYAAVVNKYVQSAASRHRAMKGMGAGVTFSRHAIFFQ